MKFPDMTILLALQQGPATGSTLAFGIFTTNEGSNGTDFVGGADRAVDPQGPGWHIATRPAMTRKDPA